MEVKRASAAVINSSQQDSELKQVKVNSNPSLGISIVPDSFQDSSTNTMVAGESTSNQDHLRYRLQISISNNLQQGWINLQTGSDVKTREFGYQTRNNENNLRQPSDDDERTRNNGNNLKQPGTESRGTGNNLHQPAAHQEESKLEEHFNGLAGETLQKKLMKRD